MDSGTRVVVDLGARLEFIVVLSLAVGVPAQAHHSVGAFFDTSAPMVIEGTVSAASWNNPHALLTIERAASGIFRVWTYGRTSDRPVVEAAYTPAALARQAEYDPLVDDPALRCEAQGMPIIMDNPFPIEFADRGDRIILELEIWDIVRTIHMTGDESPGARRGTPLGYSVGTWEGDTLVVSTTDIDGLYIDDAGTPQSDLIEAVERFTLSEDRRRLDYEAVVTDPETLLEPMVLAWHWEWVPGEALQSYGCTLAE